MPNLQTFSLANMSLSANCEDIPIDPTINGFPNVKRIVLKFVIIDARCYMPLLLRFPLLEALQLHYTVTTELTLQPFPDFPFYPTIRKVSFTMTGSPELGVQVWLLQNLRPDLEDVSIQVPLGPDAAQGMVHSNERRRSDERFRKMSFPPLLSLRHSTGSSHSR